MIPHLRHCLDLSVRDSFALMQFPFFRSPDHSRTSVVGLALGLLGLCLVFGLGTVAALGATAGNGSPLVLLRSAHAHNDYEHKRPLFDALDQGFCSVEADIFLVNGSLLVGHTLQSTHPDRTLESLYLDPLRARVKANQGKVYPEPAPFTLLIDIKTEAEPTYAYLRRVLQRYRSMLTTFEGNQTRTGAVTVILSGERPIAAVQAERRRWCALDGRISDLDTNPSPNLVPWISIGWSSEFKWKGEGPFPETEATKLRSIVERTHAQGRRLRFWGTLDRTQDWAFLQKAGVDLLNADDLPALRRFLIDSPR